MSNLRDRDAYRDAAWDWGFLNDCFGGTKIRVTDVDGMVERNGHFLFMEMKPTTGYLTKGQDIALQRLATEPNKLVIVGWGDNKSLTVTKARVMCDGRGWTYPSCSTAQFHRLVENWYRTADRSRR